MSHPTYDELWDEVRVLRKRLADLAVTDDATLLTMRTSLSRQEARVLLCLVDRQAATRDFIYAAALERDNGDGPTLKAVDVVVSKVRKRLRAAGFADPIQCVWGQGYTLSADARAWVREQLLSDLALAA